MPSLWEIPLIGPDDLRVPVEAPHAVVSRWLDDDHQSPVKGYSVTPPFNVGGRRSILTVRLLDDALAGRLVQHAAVGARIRLGSQHFTVATAPAMRRGTSWEELRSAHVCRAWEVDFRSPATFRRRNRTTPWPAPESLLVSLSARWRTLDPGTAPTLTREAISSVWVSDVEGRSQLLAIKGVTVSGFVGRLRYVCDGCEEDAGAVAALFRFAAFSGVGSHTAFGLGTVSVTDSWQPASAAVTPDLSPARVVDLDSVGSRPSAATTSWR